MMVAVILAGDRGSKDALLEVTGASCKALVPIGSEPMVLRVIRSLRASESIDQILLCGPGEDRLHDSPKLTAALEDEAIRWVAPADSPSRSLGAAFETIGSERPVLVTTADHALLRPEMVDSFCRSARASGGDVVAAVARADRVTAAFPQVRRTAFKLRDGAWCGCNLFAFLTPDSRRAAAFWRKVERERKHPLRMARIIGWTVLWRLLTKSFTLDRALAALGHRMGLDARAVEMKDPRAAIDVDSPEDWKLVSELESNQSGV